MSAAEKEEAVAQQGYTPEEFEKYWASSQELFSVLRRLPKRLVNKSGMQSRLEQMLDRWEDLQEPGLDDEISLEIIGALRNWIHDARILTHYIVSTEDVSATAPTHLDPANLPSAPRLAPIESIEKSPAVTSQWHWPWIEGWDNEKKRKRILNPKDKKETSMRRKLVYAALGMGAVYMGAKYLEEE